LALTRLTLEGATVILALPENHILMDIKGIPPGLVVLLLWLVVFYSVRSAFAGIFAAKVPETA